jgi:hypothetical protein
MSRLPQVGGCLRRRRRSFVFNFITYEATRIDGLASRTGG